MFLGWRFDIVNERKFPQEKMIKKIGLLILASFNFQSVGANDLETHIDYTSVPAQVSFKSVMELPSAEPDEKMAYGDDPFQYGLLWQPKTKSKKPLIIMIHGGCWLNAFGVDHSYPMATTLAQQGFPVWSLEYRRTGDEGGGWPGSFDDIKLALSKTHSLLKQHAQTDKIILMGHSAGGHLALLAASENTALNFSKIIGLAAITDVSRYAMGQNSCQQATPQFMSGMPSEQPTAYQNASLVYRQLPNQTILLQGNADNIVPVLQSQLHQVNSEMTEGAGHFDWIHPGSPAFKHLLKLINSVIQ